jgi:hypothetical protein
MDFSMELDSAAPDGAVLLQIQNSKRPDQVISVVLDRSNDRFETSGLKPLFGQDEIWIEKVEFLESMEEYAQVISFLLETMSAALDYNLPYAYQSLFEFAGKKYSLMPSDGYRVLRRA